MPIHTAASLTRQHRRLRAQLRRADQVLDKMRVGAIVYSEHTELGSRWALSTGRRISDSIATLVVRSESVVGDCDVLFPGQTSQVFRHTKFA
jgi:hypothetical protein